MDGGGTSIHVTGTHRDALCSPTSLHLQPGLHGQSQSDMVPCLRAPYPWGWGLTLGGTSLHSADHLPSCRYRQPARGSSSDHDHGRPDHVTKGTLLAPSYPQSS